MCSLISEMARKKRSEMTPLDHFRMLPRRCNVVRKHNMKIEGLRKRLLLLLESAAAVECVYVKNKAEMSEMICFGTSPLKVNHVRISGVAPDSLVPDPELPLEFVDDIRAILPSFVDRQLINGYAEKFTGVNVVTNVELHPYSPEGSR